MGLAILRGVAGVLLLLLRGVSVGRLLVTMGRVCSISAWSRPSSGCTSIRRFVGLSLRSIEWVRLGGLRASQAR